jgi:glycosyltransferase involved in cell wall biosynthesis
LFNGGGTRVKLLEAAGYGKAMVSTAIGVEGLHFEDPGEILVRDDDDGLAEGCVRLLNDRNLREQLGLAARKRALALYDARAIEERIEGDIRSLAR